MKWRAIISKADFKKKIILACDTDEFETKVEADKWFKECMAKKPWDESNTIDSGKVKAAFI